MKPADLRKKLDPVANAALGEFGVPGAGVGIRIDGDNHAFGYGLTNNEYGVPVDGDTLFQIGSTSKTFAATKLMQLVEEGKVSLDDKVLEYLPKFKVPDEETTQNVTLRHLVTHTAGWMGDWGGPQGKRRRRKVERGDDALRKRIGILKEVPQLAPLGTVWSYNNSAFSVLGHIIEKVTKNTFEGAVTEGIMEPLGMERSFYFPEQIMTEKFALGHVKDKEGNLKIVRPWAQGRATGPSGGVVSSAADQMTYAQFHLNQHPEGKKVLSPETVEFMQQPLAEAATMASHVGVSWLLDDINGVRTVAHGGTMVGQTSAFLMVPERGFAVTVLTNGGDEGKLVHRKLTKWALQELLGLEKPKPETQELPAESLDELAGQYSYYSYGTIDISREGNGLTLEWTPLPEVLKEHPEIAGQFPEPMSVRPIGGLKFIADEGPLAGLPLDFVRRADGSIGWMRMGGRAQTRLD